MWQAYVRQFSTGIALLAVAIAGVSCSVSAKNEPFFGKVAPPQTDILRYVNGDEPESLDPVVSSGQPEARIYMALYEGLVEYDPKSSMPIPAIAERWDENNDSSELVFHLRRNARFSNGEPITAGDFIYTIRRGLAPETASKNAALSYYIKYGQAYNSGRVFVKDPKTSQFVLEREVAANPSQEAAESLSQKPLSPAQSEYKTPSPETIAADTPFHKYMHSPTRLTLPGSDKARTREIAQNPKLQALVTGKEFVPVTADDVGIEAVDDYTLRITLAQSAPFFTGLLAHQLFRVVPRKVIAQYGSAWTEPAHIVTSGAFRVKAWHPYSEVVVERNPMYWDAANVGLQEIHFYQTSDNPTAMNLYKVGEADAVLNHTVPNAWLDVVKPKKDYMDGSEAAIVYILMNVTRPPMNDIRVRKAFNMAIDKITYSQARRITKPLSAFTPEGIFVGYPQPKGDPFDPERARKLLGEAGFPVTKKPDGSYECKSFPIDQVDFTYNTQPSNKTMAEFMQAQWRQNLGITVSLSSMEFKTFMNVRSKLEYKGFAIGLWGADYMDPLTFLDLFYTPAGNNGSGWWDPQYAKLLDEANASLDKHKRYELLAKAEKFLLDAQPMIPIETSSVNWVKKPYVKGMYPNAGSLYAWKFVHIERDPSKWDYGIPGLAE